MLFSKGQGNKLLEINKLFVVILSIISILYCFYSWYLALEEQNIKVIILKNILNLLGGVAQYNQVEKNVFSIPPSISVNNQSKIKIEMNT